MGLFATTATAVAYLIDPRLGNVLLLMAAVYYLFVIKGTIYEKLLKLIVYATPFYAFSIFANRQRFSVCMIAVVVLCVLLTVHSLKRGARIKLRSLCSLLLFLVFFVAYLLSVLWGSATKIDTLFITYQLVVLAYLAFIIPVAKQEELSGISTDALMRLFVQGICAVTIALYIQYGARVFFDITLGEIYQKNSDRVIYNVYFNAKSVLSMYLAMGMLYYFIEFINKKWVKDVVWMALFAGAFLMNNSRTGLACFGVCAALYCLRNFARVIKSVRVAAMLILIGAAGLFVIEFMLESRGTLTGILDDNGRLEQFAAAFHMLPECVFYGIGGSATDYYMSSVGVTIHNFPVAYLVQFGMFGGLAVDTLLLAPVLDTRKRHWYFLCCVIIGGMGFANWHNVLYIVPVYLIVLMECEHRHHAGLAA